MSAEIAANRSARFPGKRIEIHGTVDHVEATEWGPRVVYTTSRPAIRAYLRRGEPVPGPSKIKRFSANCLATLQSDGYVFDDCFVVE